MTVTVTRSKGFEKLEKRLKKAQKTDFSVILRRYGDEGVKALSEATPKESGETASSWDYRIVKSGHSSSIVWTNSNTNDGVNIAIILQYGHGTGTGGYVSGVDYINPALKPVFEKIAEDAWKELTK